MFNRNCGCGRQGGNGMFQQGVNGMFQQGGCQQNPIIEPVITNCVEQEFYHEVPHICPIHTHTVNRHIYNHSYTPQYTCSEEDQIVNNDCGKCSGFINR